ncbi:MAG: hypothetical protein JO036_20915 [Candidatus Eremiobacteraeota bacterium]|nr:hypothetical protein [Candidatus Eremiobacteraeota bacterium]
MHRFAPLAFVIIVVLASTAQSPSPFAWPTPLPSSAPAPQPTVLWESAPATSFALDVRPLGVSPDGEARALVRVVLHDAQGNVVRLRRGADFDYFTSRGTAQWQTRLRFGGPAAIISVRDEGPVNVRVVANRPQGLGEQRASFDTRAWRAPRTVADAVGPHLVRVGWFPQTRAGAVRVYRVGERGRRTLAATLRAPASSWDDAAVQPGRVARYAVVRSPAASDAASSSAAGEADVHADVPPELPVSTVDAMRGKSAWLAFSGDPLDDASYAKLDVDQIVATATRAGLRSVELRLAYGAFDEVTPAAKATIDRLIDELAAHRVAVIGWTVPRAPAFDDLARDAAVAAYRTPSGTALSGLAVDLERGDEYLGDGPAGFAALSAYLGALRRAVGPRVLLVATVEDPFLEHLDAAKFPYAAIARDADVLQPMTYWRMMGPWDSPDKARAAVGGSVALVRRLAAREVPVDVGAQTGVLSKRGAPPGEELTAAVEAARRAGAIGVTFYDWSGTGPEQWEAIARAAW